MKIFIGSMFATIIIASGLVWVGSYAIDKAEIAECLQWEQWSIKYEGFFLKPWQDMQCKSHGIFIETNIK